jgi:DNA-binding transcriptional ArsR family regulator
VWGDHDRFADTTRATPGGRGASRRQLDGCLGAEPTAQRPVTALRWSVAVDAERDRCPSWIGLSTGRWIHSDPQKNLGRMDTVLWQTLAGTRGGPNRARILRALDDRPRNANQLAEDLDLAYNTVRHHLDVLEDNGVVTSSDADYGTIYLPSDRTRAHWDTVETVLSQLEA